METLNQENFKIRELLYQKTLKQENRKIFELGNFKLNFNFERLGFWDFLLGLV